MNFKRQILANLDAVRDDIHCAFNLGPRNCPYNKLTSQERRVLLSLRTRTDITIKPADKGSATAVMSRWDYMYLIKVMSHLENENFYQRLDEEDPMEQFAIEVTSMLIDTYDEQTNY